MRIDTHNRRVYTDTLVPLRLDGLKLHIKMKYVKNKPYLFLILIRCFRSIHPENISNTTRDEQLNITRRVGEEELIRQMQGERNVLLVHALILAKTLERVC